MSKPKVGPEAIGNLFNKKKPKGGSSSTGKGKQQDIELGGETRPAAGARSPGGSSAVPLDKQISELLTKNGDLKDKSPEALQKLTQLIGRWEVNETTRLADLGSGTAQGSVLKYLKKSGNQEMYVSALAKSDGTLPTTALQKEYDTLVGGTQSKAPNESRPKVNNETVTHRPEKRPNRQYEKTTGNMDPNLPAYEKLQKIGNQMDGNAAADDDYLYALSQGYSPTKFDAELARIQAMTDPAERAEAINALSVNATKGMGRSSDLSTTSKFEQWLDQYLVKIDKPKTSGGGAKVGDGPLPGEKQQSLDFDGGGEATTGGPEISLNNDPELKQPETTEKKVDPAPKRPDVENQAAEGTPSGREYNANKTQNTTEGPGQVPPQGATRQPSTGDLTGENELPQLKDWARSHLLNAYINKTGRDPTVDPKAAREFEAGFQAAMHRIMEQPDPIATLKQMQAKNATTAQPAPEPTVNPAASGTASSRANAAAGGSNVPPKKPSIPPGGATPKPGRGGLAPTGQTPSATKLNKNLKNAPKVNKTNTDRLGVITGTALATGLAWKWLTGGSSSEEDVQPSASTASITDGPSTSTGSASGSVADGSGGSSGGMSQEQMENLMKLQQIRDEQKRRHVGFGNTHSGVSR